MSYGKSNVKGLKIQGVNENNYSMIDGNTITYITEYRHKNIVCELNHSTGCHEVTSNKPRNDGYVMAARMIDGKFNAGYAHRVVYEAMKGEILKGIEIMHTCDNPKCCNPNHIILGTHKENMIDKANKKRNNTQRGHQKANKVLSIQDVIFIKNNLDKYTDHEFVKMFGSVYQTYFYIRNGKNWAHVLKTDDPNDPKFANEKKRLTLIDIETILSYNFSIPQLAEMYNCSRNSISLIRAGKYPKYIVDLMAK